MGPIVKALEKQFRASRPRSRGRQAESGFDPMLYWLTELSDKISFFNVFRYITFRTGGAIVTALFLSSCSAARSSTSLRLKQGKGQPIREDGPQSHSSPRRARRPWAG